MPWDYMHQFSLNHGILLAASEVCNKHVIEFPRDVERDEFLKKCVVKMLVKVAFTGLDSGMRFQLVIDDNVSLASNPIILAQTGVLLIANLQINDMYQLSPAPRRLAVGYTFFGVWYEKISQVATAGTVNTFLDDGPESVRSVDTPV